MRALHVVAALAAQFALTGVLQAAVVFSGPVTEIDGRSRGHIQFPTQEAAIAFRPYKATERSLLVQNYYIHNLTNQKGLDVRATRINSSVPAWAYETITLRNLVISDVERREDLPGGDGLHIDHIRIAGGGNSQNVKTNITIENVEIDGGDALPILITDGVYGTVTLRNVRIKNTTLNNVQFKTDKVGSVDKIIIENSPDLGVALIGRPGSIGEVLVRNSPHVRLGDSINAAGRSGATISYVDAERGYSSASSVVPATLGLSGYSYSGGDLATVAPVPEPSCLGLLGFAWAVLARRRGR